LAALGMSDNTLKIWDWSSNTILFNLNWLPMSLPINQAYARTNVKFLANGLLAAPANNSVNIWDVTTGQVKFALQQQVYALEQLSNSNLASFGSDLFIKIWSTFTGQLLLQFKTANYHLVLKQTSIPNYLASASNNNCIYIWDVNTLMLVNTLIGHTDQVYLLELAPSGLLLSGSLDKTVRLWNVTKASSLSSVNMGRPATCMKMISDSQLVVGFQANYLQIINISSSSVLSLASQVNLITNSQLYDMRLTSENILLLCQVDGSVFFFNLNTSSFQQALTPTPLAVTFSLDLIGLDRLNC
jgi:WD40 repeat protein